jgi:hypothetical protein
MSNKERTSFILDVTLVIKCVLWLLIVKIMLMVVVLYLLRN